VLSAVYGVVLDSVSQMRGIKFAAHKSHTLSPFNVISNRLIVTDLDSFRRRAQFLPHKPCEPEHALPAS
jgi:hypothetical protein